MHLNRLAQVLLQTPQAQMKTGSKQGRFTQFLQVKQLQDFYLQVRVLQTGVMAISLMI